MTGLSAALLIGAIFSACVCAAMTGHILCDLTFADSAYVRPKWPERVLVAAMFCATVCVGLLVVVSW